MALLFDGPTEWVLHASDSTIDDLETWTGIFWCRQPIFVANRNLFNKRGAPNIGQRFMAAGAAATQVSAQVRRVTAADSLGSPATTYFVAGEWCYVAISYDFNAASGTRFQVYTGALSNAAIWEAEGGSGSGALKTEVGDNLHVGNHYTQNNEFEGDIALFGHWDSVLTFAQIKQQQYKLFPVVARENCVIFTDYGWNGTGVQPDWSGKGNNGVVTGATVAPHVPLRVARRVGFPPYSVVAPGNPWYAYAQQ